MPAKKKPAKQKKEMDDALTIKLPASLKAKAQAKSDGTGISISFVVRKALEEWVNKND